ncbi:MAG: hypothetical protein PHW73_00295 [Atribacterota bacterium]|nr:hypothetical protein [Atribacterota bacterium]
MIYNVYSDIMPVDHIRDYLLGIISDEEFQKLVYQFNPGKYDN